MVAFSSWVFALILPESPGGVLFTGYSSGFAIVQEGPYKAPTVLLPHGFCHLWEAITCYDFVQRRDGPQALRWAVWSANSTMPGGQTFPMGGKACAGAPVSRHPGYSALCLPDTRTFCRWAVSSLLFSVIFLLR